MDDPNRRFNGLRFGFVAARLLPRGLLGAVVLAVVSGAGSRLEPQRDGAPAVTPADRPKEYGPGVRIDWGRRLVEVDAAVVFREGPLELLACSPHTREHESILSIKARPLHVFQAMGLIGLGPGFPVRYAKEPDRLLPPRGEALTLKVRYLDSNVERTVPVERWLLDVKTRRPPESMAWVFAGSRTFEDGRFGADLDGTVVCVVDFDTALIAVGSLHSADNELLWLAANTEAIPPVGTPCTLVIRKASQAPPTVDLQVTADGTLLRKRKAVSVTGLMQAIQDDVGPAEEFTLVLLPSPRADEKTIVSVIDALVRAGVERSSIEVRPPAPEPSGDKPP